MPPDGLLVVDKPKGPTSHDIVARARRLFSTRAVGHAGTLDPMATGVLVLLFGEALKLSSYLTLDRKTYIAEIELGVTTDTLDAQGTVTERKPLAPDTLERNRVEAALAGERERRRQTPPVVSSIKVGGERSHRLTRRGAPPELEPRPVEVERLVLLSSEGARLSVEVTASKGYYVRALARDLGEALGTCAHLTALTRTRSGSFTLDGAVRWPPETVPPLVSVVDVARRSLPCVELTAAGAVKARLGQKLGAEHFVVAPEDERAHAWLAPEGAVVALGARTSAGSYAVLRGFRSA